MNAPSHPGEKLRELIIKRKFTQRSVAKMTGIHFVILNEILSGKRGIGPTQAIRLEDEGFGAADLWLTRQANFDLSRRLRSVKKGRKK